MARFTVQARIEAPQTQVWEALADLGGIHKWNPGVSSSYSTSEAPGGEGATRHCDLTDGRSYLKERAFDWREGEGYKIEVYETNMPLRRNVVEFRLEAEGDGTIVSVSPEYELKFGPLGAALDWLFVGRQFRKGMTELLDGLKRHVETGELASTEAG